GDLAPPARRVHRVRQLAHLERPRPIGQPADETPLLERRDQPVDAGFRPQVERILHLVKGRRYTRLLHPLVDEHEQFVLLARQHNVPSTADSEQRLNTYRCSSYVLQQARKFSVSPQTQGFESLLAGFRIDGILSISSTSNRACQLG